MTEAVAVHPLRPAQSRLIAAICVAHLMSHYYMLMLAPLLAFIRDDFDVSYTTLGLALTAFNVVSGALQTPIGFVVDRFGARRVLIAGLALSSLGYAIAGLCGSFWVFVAMYAVAGLGNTTYHPADYSLLSHHTPADRLGQVFSLHTFAGMVGGAIAPVTLLYMQSQFGWRGAYLGAGAIGLIVLLALIVQPEPAADSAGKKPVEDGVKQPASGLRLLLTPAILFNFAFFILISLMANGLNTYLVVALGALHGTPPDLANLALTSVLAMNAVGVLGGGLLTARTSRHGAVAAFGLAASGIATALVGLFDVAPVGLIILMGLSGLFVGATYPSRDMLVRAATPPGAFGRVFGFVSTGFNVGGAITPFIYGMLMDHGEPRAIFLVTAAVGFLCIPTVTLGLSRPKAQR